MKDVKTFQRGIHPGDSKSLSEKRAISSMPSPKIVYIPIVQHIGKMANIIVGEGDHVLMGQKIAEKNGDISSNIFSSVSGTVVKIEEKITSLGTAKHIVIENDGQNTEATLPPLENPTAEQIIQRVSDAGVVGMGGAGFPTAVKLSPKEKIEEFIINGAECEPYITCDYRIMLDYSEPFLKGALLLAAAVGLDKVIIAIEDNKTDAKERLDFLIAKNNWNIKTVAVKTKYPQGAEKQLIYAVTGKVTPVGKLPSFVGVVVNNVHTALSTYLAVVRGQTCYRRIMTVTGGGITAPNNLWVANGTKFSDVIDFCGGFSDREIVKIINGGPMMGLTVITTDVATTKTCSCLLLLTKEEAFTGNPSACINCGKCAAVCPMRLMPMYIDSYALIGDFEQAARYGSKYCIDCGSCSFVCPAKRPLVQSIRLAKRKAPK